MTTDGGIWALHIEAATLAVQSAIEGDAIAGTEVLSRSIIALRGWLNFNEQPDPHQIVYLKGLLACLEDIARGDDPGTALHLKHGHRRPSESVEFRDVWLCADVGKELDRLTIERGHTRIDKPIESAIRSAAKKWGVGIATVEKAWRNYGGAKGWQAKKGDWK